MPVRPSIRNRRDRWADWAVIGIVMVALVLGWAVMTTASSACVTATDEASGLTLCHPPNWILTESEGAVFGASDPSATEFKTTYTVQEWPIQASQSITSTLALVLNNASLSRAQSGVSSYRLLNLAPGAVLDEGPTMEASYVYVSIEGDPFSQNLPVVVMGLDVALAMGDQAYVFSLAAAQDGYDEAERAFRRFVRSAEFDQGAEARNTSEIPLASACSREGCVP